MNDKVVFDKKQLLTMSGDDEELAAQVAGIFLNDMPKQLARLRQAMDAKDIKSAERTAHSIKGASATVGGEALREAALRCERLGHEGKLDELAPLFMELCACYGELKMALVAEGYVGMDPE